MPLGGGNLGSQAQVLRRQPARLPRRWRGELHVRGGGRRAGRPSGWPPGPPSASASPRCNLQRDLSFSQALGELQLRARPACSDHPRRVRGLRMPSGPESGAGTRGELAVSPVPGGAGVGDTADPQAALLGSGGRAPPPGSVLRGEQRPAQRVGPRLEEDSTREPAGPLCPCSGDQRRVLGRHGRVSALGTARGREGRTRGLTVSPDSDGDGSLQVTNEDRGVGPHPHRTSALIRSGVRTHARPGR